MRNLKERAVRVQAAKYVAVVLMQRVFGLACFLLAAGTLRNVRGWIYFTCYFATSVVTLAVMYRGHAETLSERGRKHENTKRWDRVLLVIYVPCAFYLIYVVAGFGVRFGWSAERPDVFVLVGVALYILSAIFTVWPLLENKHFESTARIQGDRAQTVVSTGPYRLVRHPGYAAIVVWALSVPLIFGSAQVAIVSAVVAVTTVVRTHLEDRMLQNELLGYADYARRVRYRLVPFIW